MRRAHMYVICALEIHTSSQPFVFCSRSFLHKECTYEFVFLYCVIYIPMTSMHCFNICPSNMSTIRIDHESFSILVYQVGCLPSSR
jgi:hypothetical protein